MLTVEKLEDLNEKKLKQIEIKIFQSHHSVPLRCVLFSC